MPYDTFCDGTPYYSGQASFSKTYRFTKVLHYEDGSTLVNETSIVNRNPTMAINRMDVSSSEFHFWNDHDPRIVSVEFIYSPSPV